ncbi:MAG: aminofutalosine synthase MqnE [Saprospiraceae bacterium]|nr:aminofutalosine synthase MqnE [Saprospiraceae bacterium]MBK8451649.1 aminofutalosine synthase MqnE [Saprospiraceae bacterium]MBK9221125.1 aminofutalosine synthase MqnE [Saprospiraceae bacterium]MBK9722023.1 aminofutalosine synthase MqnE [Saprospiraceae bacterium]
MILNHMMPDLQSTNAQLNSIRNKVYSGHRISFEDGLYLFKNADLSWLGSVANYIREQKHGDKTYFNKNFHIEPTNVCLYTCSFCSYSRLIKKRAEGWEYSLEQMMDIVKSFDEKPVTEVHIVGGVMPKYDLEFYCKLFEEIKKHRPGLHIKALTPVEYHYIFKKAKVSYEEGMKQILDAGVDSLPGGGAEIFDEKLRDKIAGGKCSSEEWLRIHEIWHNLGMKSNATMLYGHLETYEMRVDHLERLRLLQDKTNGFQTFIPLKFRNQNNELSYLEEVSIIEDLRNYAISRIYLDNFDHIKAYWPMLGRDHAQLSLSFGVNDMDGTIDDTTKIYSMAGSEEQSPSMTTGQLVSLIQQVGRTAIERDSLYHPIKVFEKGELAEDTKRSYYQLPVN